MPQLEDFCKVGKNEVMKVRKAILLALTLSVLFLVRAFPARAERVAGPDGRPRLLVDGRPYPGLLMQNYETTAEGAEAFGKVGLYIWEVDIWEPNNWEEVDRKVLTFLRGNPEALILLRVGLPKYPDEPEYYADISTAEDGTRWGLMAGVAKWFTVGEITEKNAPPRRWTKLVFNISKVDRRGVVRPFDLVIWHFDRHIPKGARLRFYLDQVEYFSSANPEKRLLVADMESPKGLHDQVRYPEPPVIAHDIVKFGKGSLLWEHVQDGKHDGLVCRGLESPRDLREFDRMSLWLYPDTDAPFRIVVRVCGGLRRMGYPSFASERWARDCKEVLRKLMRHIEAMPYRDNIIGFTLAGGLSAEWAWAGQSADCGLDFCQAARRAWRRFLKERYGSFEALRRAWGRDAEGIRSFDEVPVPGRRVRFAEPELGDFFDPRRHRMFVDYNEFVALTTARRIAEFAEFVKRESRGRLLVGALFGYWGGYGDRLGKQAQQSGHAMPEPAFRSPHLDYIAAPLYYDDRDIGGPSIWSLPVDTLQLHGKVVVNEADTPTHVHQGFKWLRPRSLAESLEVLKRDVAATLSKGMFQWWFFSHLGGTKMLERAPEIVQLAGRLNGVMEESLHTDRSSVSEVAFVYDRHSLLCLHPKSMLPGFIYYQMPELMRMGAPFDIFLLSDIGAVARKRYKLVILFGTYWLDKEQRKAIDKLKRGGRTLVFVYAPGIVGEDGVGPEKVTEVTGVRLRAVERRMPVEVEVVDNSHPITAGLPRGFSFGGRFREPQVAEVVSREAAHLASPLRLRRGSQSPRARQGIGRAGAGGQGLRDLALRLGGRTRPPGALASQPVQVRRRARLRRRWRHRLRQQELARHTFCERREEKGKLARSLHSEGCPYGRSRRRGRPVVCPSSPQGRDEALSVTEALKLRIGDSAEAQGPRQTSSSAIPWSAPTEGDAKSRLTEEGVDA